MKKVIIHTDGSCLGNPGPGGWAAILCLADSNYSKEICGGFRLTTNNRMEIMAAVEGLGALKKPSIVELYTDSQYLRDSLEKRWVYSWQKHNWLKADNKPAQNVDLWKKLLQLVALHKVTICWLRGHTGIAANERCDELARNCAASSDLPPDIAYELLLNNNK